MKMLLCIISIIIFIEIISSNASSIERIECRGQIATGNITWNPQNFAGFFYDINKDIGTETIVAVINDTNETEVLNGESPYGLIYNTYAHNEDFEFRGWGSYKVIGFLGDKYFVGFNGDKNDPNKNHFLEESNCDIILSDRFLGKILMNENTQTILEVGKRFNLYEGYSLIIRSIDYKENIIEAELLNKYGEVINKDLSFTPYNDDTNIHESTIYYIKESKSSSISMPIIIAIHFNRLYNGTGEEDQQIHGVVIDGVWQLSENLIPVKCLDKAKLNINIRITNNITIYGNNLNNPITLVRGRDTDLIDNFGLKVSKGDTLRYHIYKVFSDPGKYEIRSSIAENSTNWTAKDFAGFYYDIDENLNTEQISTRVTDRKLSGVLPYGLVYTTSAQIKNFSFEDWGSYYAMGFIGNEYFAGYVPNEDSEKGLFFRESDEYDIFEDEKLRRVLINDNTQKPYELGDCIPLDNNQGYSLRVKEINSKRNKVRLELRDKNGTMMDDSVMSISKNIDSDTFRYEQRVSSKKNLTIIAVHILNVFNDTNGTELATVDGIWQISDMPTIISKDCKFNKMTVTDVNVPNRSIKMCNKYQQINLKKNKRNLVFYKSETEWPPRDDESIMENIWIKTADNDTLRYYLYHLQSINSTLNISSNPGNASIYVDGNYIGVTPRSVNICSGSHDISFKKPGFAAETRSIIISKIYEDLHVNLTQLPCNITLKISPPDAKVYIDNKLYEEKYIEVQQNVTHDIYVLKDNYKDYKSTLNCKSTANKLEIKLESIINETTEKDGKKTWTTEMMELIFRLLSIPGALLAVIMLRDYYKNKKKNENNKIK